MKQDNFKNQLKRLSANMGRAIPIENVPLIYDELSWIPDEAFPDLISAAIDTWESWPRNLPGAIKALWYDWQSKRRAVFEPTGCKYCNSEGLLWQLVDGYDTVFACGHCENWQKHFGGSLAWKVDNRHFVIKTLRMDDIPF
jgi:hypothetical protein